MSEPFNIVDYHTDQCYGMGGPYMAPYVAYALQAAHDAAQAIWLGAGSPALPFVPEGQQRPGDAEFTPPFAYWLLAHTPATGQWFADNCFDGRMWPGDTPKFTPERKAAVLELNAKLGDSAEEFWQHCAVFANLHNSISLFI